MPKLKFCKFAFPKYSLTQKFCVQSILLEPNCLEIWCWLDGRSPVDDVEEVLNDGHLLVNHLHLALHHLQPSSFSGHTKNCTQCLSFISSLNIMVLFVCFWWQQVKIPPQRGYMIEFPWGWLEILHFNTYIHTRLSGGVSVWVSFECELYEGVHWVEKSTEIQKYRNGKDEYDCICVSVLGVWVRPLIGSNCMERADGIGILLACIISLGHYIWRTRICNI